MKQGDTVYYLRPGKKPASVIFLGYVGKTGRMARIGFWDAKTKNVYVSSLREPKTATSGGHTDYDTAI